MDSSRNDDSPESKPPTVGIVVGRDLMFTAKVTGTASEMGYQMRVAGDIATALALIEEWRPRLILVDLAAGELAAPPALGDYRRLAGPSAWLVAVGPHVEPERLAQAREAGCQLALPRSKFSAGLPELLQRCFTQPADSSSSGFVV
jgi:hypothetical protein